MNRARTALGIAAALLTVLTTTGIAHAAETIDYERAGNYPTIDACADAGHSMPDIKSWLCDEEPDGTHTLYIVRS